MGGIREILPEHSSTLDESSFVSLEETLVSTFTLTIPELGEVGDIASLPPEDIFNPDFLNSGLCGVRLDTLVLNMSNAMAQKH
jgi:hypothetical protein